MKPVYCRFCGEELKQCKCDFDALKTEYTKLEELIFDILEEQDTRNTFPSYAATKLIINVLLEAGLI